MNKHPSIEQFRHVIRNVKYKAQFVGLDEDGNPVMNRHADLPTLTFTGTVKLHGTNSSIVFSGEDISFQSRNRILSIGNDNAGFMDYMNVSNGAWMKDLRDKIIESIFPITNPTYDSLTVYGEWCGGNIQKGVAITNLPKMFVIFGVRVINGENDVWVHSDLWKDVEFPIYNIFNIHKFQTFSVDIDFNKPELSQNILGKITEDVEKECPVGKHFGVTGIGEGVVWKCNDQRFNDSSFWFKVKGEKHSASKVKTLAPVDIEKLKTIDEFVERVITTSRLNQGIDYLNEMGLEITQKSTGTFISWVFKDVMKEESDVLEASGLDRKDIGKPIGDLVRKWYFKKVDML